MAILQAKRKVRSRDLAEAIGIAEQNVSLLKSGKVKGIRFDALEKICAALDCQPGDILEFTPEAEAPFSLTDQDNWRAAQKYKID
ncbi:MAG: transcriptional regulator [Alphaproteobacteria bacterium]|nr:transcriptional regulator [Alphaproteobacteria bacterium]